MSCHCNNQCCNKPAEEKNENIYLILKVAISLVFFIIGLVFIHIKINPVLYGIIFTISIIVSGYDVLFSAVKSVIHKKIFDENFLLCIAVIGAMCIKEFPEAAAVIILFRIGEVIEEYAITNSNRSVEKLMDIRPDKANLVTADGIKTVSPEDVEIGDVIEVKAGERIPLDGIVLSGIAEINTAALTGESMLKAVSSGDEVLSGCINTNGLLNITVTKRFENSTVSKIIKMVSEAGDNKPKTEKFITKFAKYYTPTVVGLALFVVLIPTLFLKASFSEWFNNALVFLVISCPCALVISVPLSYYCGIGCASKNGILIKSCNILEAFSKVSAVVFDKTGTLTKGEFEVTDVCPADGVTQKQLLKFAALAECSSNHPIAKSIIKQIDENINTKVIKGFEEIIGRGVIARVKNIEIIVGNEEMLLKRNIAFTKNDSVGTKLYVAMNKRFLGSLVVNDVIKDDSKSGINKLHELGINRLVMLTGDNESSAIRVNETLGLDEYLSGLLPNDKVEHLKEITHKYIESGSIIFVGDGINDAPVLASAQIGVAMGGLGSDAAVEASDAVIMTDNISKISSVIKISNFTKNIVWQNIIFALGVKIIIMILSLFGMATMWMAVFSDVGVCIITIFNALRILSTKKEF